MGLLSSEIRKEMAEQKLQQVDFDRLTKGVVTQSTISAIFRGATPTKPNVIDAIAIALKQDPKKYRRLVAKDLIDKKLAELDVSLEDICEVAERTQRFKLPVYDFKDLPLVLSTKGYPTRNPGKARNSITVPIDYGRYAYGIRVKDNALFPRVLPGEIAIVSQDHKTNPAEDYGILAVSTGAGENKIFIGKIREQTKFVIVEIMHPYSTELLKKKEVLFIHKIVAINAV